MYKVASIKKNLLEETVVFIFLQNKEQLLQRTIFMDQISLKNTFFL